MNTLIIDIAGLELSREDKEILQHPHVSGLILFSRNYQNLDQLQSLVTEIRTTVKRPFLLTVDQEGGRVQRLIEGFTRLPAFRQIAQAQNALQMAYAAGWIMASETRACGIDLSFTPVIDRDIGNSEIIGDRSFHAEVGSIVQLAHAYIRGMHEAGMPATGKHFPGHGYVAADSHIVTPVDERSVTEIMNSDLIPFQQLNNLDAMMMAHVIYSQADELPASFSSFWIQDVLRQQLQFDGVVFSDDLSMAGAEGVGDYLARAEVALEAGCDLLLACNNRVEVIKLLDRLKSDSNALRQARIQKLFTAYSSWQYDSLASLQQNPQWQKVHEAMLELREM